jgi:putative transposase
MRFRTASHTKYTIFYHIVFLPKYRRKIFQTPEIEKDLKETIRKMAPFHDWKIEQLETDRNHIHIFLSAPPRYSPSNIVKLIKTWTEKRLCEKYPQKVKQYLWGGRFWCRGFYISTVSDRTTKDEVKRYIKEQKKHHQQTKLL